MSKFLDYLVHAGERISESRTNSMKTMYSLNWISDDKVQTTIPSGKPDKRYTLHQCSVCDTEHY
jgi:hypothetical protein